MRAIDGLRRSTLLGVGIVLLLSAGLDVIVALRASPTTDEWRHFEYGAHILQLHPDRRYNGFYDSQMPISALNALFTATADRIGKVNATDSAGHGPSHFRTGRFATILATLILTVFVFLWSYDLYGDSAGIAAAVLCMLSPNLIAHGTLITTDLYLALAFVVSMYFFRRYLMQPTTARAIVSALVLAVAQVTKPFAVVLYPIVAIVLLIAVLRHSTRASFSLRRLLIFAVAAAGSFIVVLNVAYCFDRPFMSLGSYAFETSPFSRLQTVSITRHLMVPVPYPYLQGMDLTVYGARSGRTSNNYLLGELRDPHARDFRPFASYYVVAWFFKEPIGLQILFLWGLFWIFRHRQLSEIFFGEGLLLIVAAALTVWLSLFNGAQIGIRHVLPALAVEVVIASGAFTHFQARPWPVKTMLCLLIVWVAVSVARYYPQMIPYMNEWAHDPRYAWKILADSNLDWGQDDALVHEFLKNNPDVQVDPTCPRSGRVLVGANRLTGIYRDNTSCVFLSKEYQPVAQVGYAHFLFVVPNTGAASGKAGHP